MPLRTLATALCLLPLPTLAADVVISAPQSVAKFVRLANLLPCQANISALAPEIGFRPVGTTEIDIDYVDIQYAADLGHTTMTVALEQTPIGAQFSLALELPETDRDFSRQTITALRGELSLPPPVPLQNLAKGFAYSWNVTLSGGQSQITVRQFDMTTQVFAILAPQNPGTQVIC